MDTVKHKYLHIQETHRTDKGHVGQLPWPVYVDAEGTVRTPSSRLGMVNVLGFQADADVQRVDVRFKDGFADPSKIIGMYVVAMHTDGKMYEGTSPIASAEIEEFPQELPVER